MVYLAARILWGGAAERGRRQAGQRRFARFVQFINRVADYTIPIGAAFSVLGLVWGGILFQAGDARGPRARLRRARARHRAAVEADRRLMTRRRAWSIGLATLVALLVVPASAQAQIGLPGLPNPLDLGVPNPVELIGNVFEYVLETFFGLETKVTQRTVSWLLAAPVYTDQGAYRELNELRGSIEVAAWALFTLVFCVSAVRYYASGSPRPAPMRRSRRSPAAAWRPGRWSCTRRRSGRWRSPPTG